MRLLNDSDRSYILSQLTLAPDSVLANAMLEFNAIRDKIVAVRKFAVGNVEGSAPVVQEAISKAAELTTAPVRKNVSPGLSTITKIGSQTKADLLEELEEGVQPHFKYIEHLKLLWARGEVKYDGKEYYL